MIRLSSVACPSSPRWRMALLFLMVATPHTWAQKPEGVTAGEMALLPPYCPDTQLFKYGDRVTNPSPNANFWISKMGTTFWAMHHYCWALIRMNRAKQIGVSAPMREGHIKGALADYEYVLTNATSEFPLSPEILTRMGDAYLLLGATGAAMEVYARARQIKPDYWPPYVAWAEVLVGIGKREEAVALVEDVIKLQPDDPVLQARYKRLLVAAKPAQRAKVVTPSTSAASGVRPLPRQTRGPNLPASAAR
jgi:hypothetical protein